MSEVGKDILQGLNEALDYAKGKNVGRAHHIAVPEAVDVAVIRERQGLSQAQFCRRYRIPLKTLRNWEQGIRRPDLSARILLHVIDREPEAVARALSVPEAAA